MQTNHYFGITHTQFSHSDSPRIGVLLTNLGTPDSPTFFALRRYLKQFLSDPRVIEINRIVWWFILYFVILVFRPSKSAANYRKIWTKDGSPLLSYSQTQKDSLALELKSKLGDKIEVGLAMRYGIPSMGEGLRQLLLKNVDRLLVIPLYPQYAAPTTGTTFDALADELKKVRYVPDLRFINKYHDEPGYIQALVNSIKECFAQGGPPEKLIFSYHGVPERNLLNGDPYYCHCHKTTRLVAQALHLAPESYLVCFQSLFGKEEWLKPTLLDTVRELARSGVAE